MPLLGINHLEGHIYSLWLAPEFDQPDFPLLALIVSGGHSELALMKQHGLYQRLGGTIDDAAGEAFDKVGRLLGLPFPGGPAIEKAATTGDPRAFRFPRAKTDGPYDLSFSGLKTAVMRAATVQPTGRRNQRRRGAEREAPLRDDVNVADIAAAFQDALTDALEDVACRAVRDFDVRQVLIAGGVSANSRLRQKLSAALDLPLYYPPLPLCTDNAAMIGAAAYFRLRDGFRSSLDFEARPSWRLSEDVYAESASRV